MPVLARIYLLVFVSVTLCGPARGEEIRDFYSEPGLNPFKETLHQENHEHIDPFSGTLQHKHVDLFIPGNGGMDIKITRVYTSLQEHLGVRTVTGAGWTMHFGRLVVPTAHKDKLCAQDTYNARTEDNPSIEFPDGGRELLMLDAVHGQYLVTRSGWRMKCNSEGEGVVVTSPAGTTYTMGALNTLNNHWSWYTTRIEDLHHNTIDITYKTTWNFICVDKITASDGRLVSFLYEDEGTPDIRLSRIVANDQTWIYRYERVDTPEGLNYYYLSEMVRPDGLRWRYRYYPFNGAQDAAGNYSMQWVTYPYGATITYTYKKIDFDPSEVDGQWDDPTTVVATKTVSGAPPDGSSVGAGSSLPGGVWTFDYEPKSPELFLAKDGTWLSGLDKTTVVMPGGRQVYYHYGFSYTGVPGSGVLWLTGMLYKQETWDGSCGSTNGPGVHCNLVESVYNDWAPRLMSHEDFWHGRGAREDDSYAPQLMMQIHRRDGIGYRTDYENYDDLGNTRRIIERSNLSNHPDKVTEISYYIDKVKWIVHQAEDETVVGPDGETVSHVDRTIDDHGKVVTEDNNGVVTNYSYTENGDLERVTDARGNASTFSDYKGGTAQREEHPESVTLSRVVNDTGTVASETNGRGYTRAFSYDAMNRLTGIIYPRNAPVDIIWDGSGKTLTRGNYQDRIELDGFGRLILTTRSDTALGISITRTLRYDVNGNKIFESYPSSEGGISYAYDILKRITEIQHPDGAHRAYVYDGPGVTETDERGNSTAYIYRAYGAPDKDKVLAQITAPNNIITVLLYDPLNHLTRVHQGEKNPSDGLIHGYSRTFVYDSRFYLISVDDPETGVTSYGRDALGNMISRQTGSSGATHYVYDARNRQVFSDYPGTTPDVATSYDPDGHIIQISNGASVIDYRYDENDNLVSQTLRMGDTVYALGLDYDHHDFLARLTYPSGRSIDYLPDALGRPTKAAPYVSAVAYHAGGQLAQVQYTNGGQTDIRLDARQRIASLTHQGLAELGYEYDLLGNVLSIADPFNPGEDRRFDYDALNRLKSAQGRWGAGSFEYDAFGNLTLMAQGADTHRIDYNGLRLRSVLHNNATRSWYHALSGDGRYVAFDSASPNFVAGDTNNVSDVFVHDRRTRATIRISVAIDGHEAYMNQPSLGPVISTDGRYVAFASSGLIRPRPLPHDYRNPPTWNVFVHDRETGKTSLVSAPFDESFDFDAPYMVGHSFNPALTADGRSVVFDSTSNYLVRGDETPSHEIFVRDRATATTTQIDGVSEISPNAVISAHGRYVAFAAYSNEAVGQILVHDRDTGETTLMSVANDGTRGNDDSNRPALSADGRYVVFESEATNLVEGDTNGTADVFVKDRFPPPVNELPHADAGSNASASGGATVILDARASRDPDGSIIAYLWQQTAGTPVGLNDESGTTASFVAPTLPTPEELSFAVTVVDNRGAGTTDTVVIHIEPLANPAEPPASPADTAAPSTHYQRKRTRVDGVPAYTVTLTPNEPASVRFRVKGLGRIVRGARPISDWQPYSRPFTVKLARAGRAQVMFYAIDAAGNVESIKHRILRRRR